MPSRQEALNRFLQEAAVGKVWDVIVIGGGATGLGAGVDAASRGFSVLVLEGKDFAKGTSSRSTKLVHGGVRYLAQGNIALVREALAERGRLARNASHLVRPLSFVIPTYRWFDRPFYWIGMVLYDLLAGALGIGRSRWLSLAKTVAYLPTVAAQGLKGGVQYHDAQFDDARLAISLVRTLFKLGGNAVNYLPVTGLLKEPEGAGEQISGVTVEHPLSGQPLSLSARTVINATGVWVDDVRRMDDPNAKARLAPSQGVHLVVDESFHPSSHALLIPKTEDGRVLFVVPWLGKTVLGTTDTPRDDAPSEPKPLQEEIEFILGTAAKYLNKKPTRSDVLSVFVGLRPLVKPEKDDSGNTSGISREHSIFVSKTGLITITGGKWTTYRSMAEEVIDKAISLFKLPKRQSKTADMLLHGATANKPTLLNFDSPIDGLGSDRSVVNALPGANEILHPRLNLSRAMVVFFVRNELANSVEDVLARRHRSLFLDAKSAIEVAPLVADILAEELKWEDGKKEESLRSFLDLAKGYLL